MRFPTAQLPRALRSSRPTQAEREKSLATQRLSDPGLCASKRSRPPALPPRALLPAITLPEEAPVRRIPVAPWSGSAPLQLPRRVTTSQRLPAIRLPSAWDRAIPQPER